MNRSLNEIHGALLDLNGFVNRRQPDEALLGEAGVTLDRALLPLLVRIERRGPIGVVDLADLAGRDHSTVSRQVAKLESLGLVKRRPAQNDRRVREAAVTEKGLAITKALDRARERLAAPLQAKWSSEDLADLARLLRRLADDVAASMASGGKA
jgi:DNA-binding MarR family transcriptional regulator